MEASQITFSANVGEENVSPDINVNFDDLETDKKYISIAFEDKMKSLSPRTETDPNASFYDGPNLCTKSNTMALSKSNRARSDKNKYEINKKANSRTLRKTLNETKSMIFLGDCGTSILSSSSATENEEEGIQKKPRKRKPKNTRKNITSTKKLKVNETSRDSIPFSNMFCNRCQRSYYSTDKS